MSPSDPGPGDISGRLGFELDGRAVEVPDDGSSLLVALRDHLGARSPKDGCSPQGQCGCCTVLVDGTPRVSCVTPARRVVGRVVTTTDGLDPATRERWAGAFCATGASQCGFCTPGIVMRLEGLRREGTLGDPGRVDRALAAHLCRCTGWQTIAEAAARVAGVPVAEATVAGVPVAEATVAGVPVAEATVAGVPVAEATEGAGLRAALEGGVAQRVSAASVLGSAGFADDTSPPGCLVAVPDPDGGLHLGSTVAEARAAAGKVQGRRTTLPPTHPLTVPPGPWDVVLRTAWVEPAYLEVDVSWCEPGGDPAGVLANGGAFGAKIHPEVTALARAEADRLGRPVKVVWSREDVVRRGPKRPPLAAGLRRDGTGVIRVVRTPGVAERIGSVLPLAEVEEVDVPGPPTSIDLRAAGWAEGVALRLACGLGFPEDFPARVDLGPEGVRVRVDPGEVLDAVTLRSYCIGAVHAALGQVWSEGLAVDSEGGVRDLTIRSFGVLKASDTPHVEVEIGSTTGPPVAVSDAVYAATLAAAWGAAGYPGEWPTGRPDGLG